MKRNRESKYRMKVISYLHLNKQKQKEFDNQLKKHKISYCEMYRLLIEKDYYTIYEIISNAVEKELMKVSWSEPDTFQVPDFLNDKRPCYLGVDFAKGNDWTGRIVLNEKENT